MMHYKTFFRNNLFRRNCFVFYVFEFDIQYYGARFPKLPWGRIIPRDGLS